ncbi:hypothetical protein [Paracoccus sp. NSM]|uniref:hypothetical protein n=1 Tax=Paracoccus sp. NSM TaxID=3457784 RepID=UPI00403735E2
MTDRPMIFSGPMVRALLDGRKTQTRRVLRVPAWIDPADDISAEVATGFIETSFRRGDRVWVREAFAQSGAAWPRIQEGLGRLHYRSDPDHGWQEYWGRWRPSIHMPRWASRITLHITDVRVQRLQDISEADAVAEGAPVAELRMYPELGNARHWFCDLWNSLHSPDAWDTNPWVCALTFTVQRSNIDSKGESQ